MVIVSDDASTGVFALGNRKHEPPQTLNPPVGPRIALKRHRRTQVPGKCAAGVMPNITFKESVVMGTLNRSRFELDHLLRRLATKYRGDTYDLVRHRPENNTPCTASPNPKP